MGTWGTALFSDDDACDVRDSYRYFLEEGLTGPEATRRMLDEHAQDLRLSSEFRAVFWLALADTQWRLGRLEDMVKEKALEAIDSGTDLERWEEAHNPKQVRKRKEVLAQLRQRLVGQQRAETRVRRPWRLALAFEVGDCFTFRLADGRLILFRVIEVRDDRSGRAHEVVVLNWDSPDPPAQEQLELLPVSEKLSPQPLEPPLDFPAPPAWLLLDTGRKRDDPSDRIQLIGRAKGDLGVPSGWTRPLFWSHLDEVFLAQDTME